MYECDPGDRPDLESVLYDSDQRDLARLGNDVKVPFKPGRMDASQEQTCADSFAVLELVADGFRKFARKGLEGTVAELLLDKAQLLTLTAPEMTVLKNLDRFDIA